MIVDRDRLANARRLLAPLGVRPEDLLGDNTHRTELPTWAEYLPQVIAAAGPGANRTYWTRMATAWGSRALDEVVASDIEAMQHLMTATARSRRNTRSGRHAGEHVVAAARAVYNRAIADGLIAPGASPAHKVAKPRRLPNTRRARTPGELAAINTAAQGQPEPGRRRQHRLPRTTFRAHAVDPGT
jgi:hypothetical protein